MDCETTAGINKQYLAWDFPKNSSIVVSFQVFIDLARLLLPPGNQRDRHSLFATHRARLLLSPRNQRDRHSFGATHVAVLANIINLCYYSLHCLT